MNFLAHLYLSGDDPEVMVGNFIGDFVKGGNLRGRFRPGIAAGIELHRAIDDFTDAHPVVDRSKQRLRPELRHYSPVVADMFYDHFLAANWNRYHSVPLPLYAAGVYRLLETYHDILPESVMAILPYMVGGNWLVSYAHIEGIQRALNGMAARTPYESGMETATDLLRAHYDSFKEDFTEFFPELTRFVEEYRSGDLSI
jgi:acyl carrier protein phosphodiesterase